MNEFASVPATTSSLLLAPAVRFGLSPREVDVLVLLLDGEKIDAIGCKLHITASTIADDIRSMIVKSESRNRTELIARVLGWERSTRAR